LAGVDWCLVLFDQSYFVKLSYRYGIDAITFLTLHMAFALPFYVVILVWAAKPAIWRSLSKRQWLSVVAMGLLGYYLSSIFDFAGLQLISAGLERLILFLYPTIVVLIGVWFFKKKVTIRVWPALAAAYADLLVPEGWYEPWVPHSIQWWP
jgi:drug/metabolite transporter (DMT)-like permease